MSGIKLARRTQSGLKKLNYVSVQTTFITDAGPKPGTIWFDKQQPTFKPSIVKHVDIPCNAVRYECGGWDELNEFIESVEEGRYILIGVTSDPVYVML